MRTAVATPPSNVRVPFSVAEPAVMFDAPPLLSMVGGFGAKVAVSAYGRSIVSASGLALVVTVPVQPVKW